MWSAFPARVCPAEDCFCCRPTNPRRSTCTAAESAVTNCSVSPKSSCFGEEMSYLYWDAQNSALCLYLMSRYFSFLTPLSIFLGRPKARRLPSPFNHVAFSFIFTDVIRKSCVIPLLLSKQTAIRPRNGLGWNIVFTRKRSACRLFLTHPN